MRREMPMWSAACVVAIALAAGGCGRKLAEPAHAPLYAGPPSDVAVVLNARPMASRGAHETSRPRSAIDWVNVVTRAIGPVRVVSPSASNDSLALSRILIVPFGETGDRQLAKRARALADSGRIILVIDLVDPSENAAERTKARSKIPGLWHGEGVVLLMNERTESEVVARLRAATPFPRLRRDPLGRIATLVPAFVGPAAAVGLASERAAASGIAASAFLTGADVAVEDLERIRRAGGAIGSCLDGAALEREPSPERREAIWRNWRKSLDKLRKLGATTEEVSIAFSELPPRSEVSKRLSSAGVRLVSAAGKPSEWFFSESAPYQATDRTGGPLPLLVVPVTHVATPPASADGGATADTTWLAPLRAADAAGVWVTRIDAHARFWEARARTPLTSSWDGTRLGVECEPTIDGLTILIPATAAGKTLSEILFNGATTTGEAVDLPDGPCIRLTLSRGRNGVWAIYK